MIITPIMTISKLEQLIVEHTVDEHTCPNGMFLTVSKPLHVYKKAQVRSLVINDRDLGRRAVVAMVIPQGERIYISHGALSYCSGIDDRKMRASAAVVTAIAMFDCSASDMRNDGWWMSEAEYAAKQPSRLNPEWVDQFGSMWSERDAASSLHSQAFVYRVGERMEPSSFSAADAQCTAGIHFFVDLLDALVY